MLEDFTLCWDVDRIRDIASLWSVFELNKQTCVGGLRNSVSLIQRSELPCTSLFCGYKCPLDGVSVRLLHEKHDRGNNFDIFVDTLSLYIFTIWKSIAYNLFCRDEIYFDKILVSEYNFLRDRIRRIFLWPWSSSLFLRWR
jgi:hypothetical protein